MEGAKLEEAVVISTTTVKAIMLDGMTPGRDLKGRLGHQARSRALTSTPSRAPVQVIRKSAFGLCDRCFSMLNRWH
jgi:hypothetical protein